MSMRHTNTSATYYHSKSTSGTAPTCIHQDRLLPSPTYAPRRNTIGYIPTIYARANLEPIHGTPSHPRHPAGSITYLLPPSSNSVQAHASMHLDCMVGMDRSYHCMLPPLSSSQGSGTR